jgi:TatD DNase family protein
LIRQDLPPLPDPLPVPTTDAHTHLGSTAQGEGMPELDAIAAALAMNVTRLVEVGTDLESSKSVVALAQAYPEVIASVAIHPNDAAQLGPALGAELDQLAALVMTSPKIRGIGETGLDYYRTQSPEGQELQRQSFAAHIAWAKAYDKALVIHSRDAQDDLLAVLDAEGSPERVQMHCFSGDAGFAKACLDRGYFLSFAGQVTFKANEELREALDVTPSDRLLVETDAPYLTPMPHRGRPNSSYLLPHTVRFIAERRGVDLVDLCHQLDANATAVFGEWGEAG